MSRIQPQDASLLATQARLSKRRSSNDVAGFWASEVEPDIEKRASQAREYVCVLELEPDFAKELEAYGKSLGWVCFIHEEDTLFVKWGKEAEERLAFEKRQRSRLPFVILIIFAMVMVLLALFKASG